MEPLEVFEFYPMFSILLSKLLAPMTVLVVITLAFCKQTVHRSIWLSASIMFIGAFSTYSESPESVLKVIVLLVIGGAAGVVHLYKRQKYASTD